MAGMSLLSRLHFPSLCNGGLSFACSLAHVTLVHALTTSTGDQIRDSSNHMRCSRSSSISAKITTRARTVLHNAMHCMFSTSHHTNHALNSSQYQLNPILQGRFLHLHPGPCPSRAHNHMSSHSTALYGGMYARDAPSTSNTHDQPAPRKKSQVWRSR